jgi:hypothetical protein
MRKSIQELAEDLAKAKTQMAQMGMMNTPTDLFLKIKSDARYQLAVNGYMKASQDYSQAIKNLSSEELLKLSVA